MFINLFLKRFVEQRNLFWLPGQFLTFVFYMVNLTESQTIDIIDNQAADCLANTVCKIKRAIVFVLSVFYNTEIVQNYIFFISKRFKILKM